MDGIHDMGGMQGFGPVTVTHDYRAFQSAWEGRQWALDRAGLSHDGSIDWWRHVVERIEPQVYLTVPYFEKWLLTDLACLVASGAFTPEEILAGHTANRGTAPAARTLDQVIEDDRKGVHSYRVEIESPPGFAVGDAVRTRRTVASDHTRLPRYARDRLGTVVDWNGAHPLPDLSARGVTEPQHLYTVSFPARELWGPDANAADTVRLDLWESYLVRA